jgi:hypothetical protein
VSITGQPVRHFLEVKARHPAHAQGAERAIHDTAEDPRRQQGCVMRGEPLFADMHCRQDERSEVVVMQAGEGPRRREPT